jgi:hypothetical protein
VVAGEDVGLPPDEAVVEGEQALAVAERGTGHGHLTHPVNNHKARTSGRYLGYSDGVVSGEAVCTGR